MVNKVKRLGKETLIYGTSTILARMLNFFLVPFYTYYLITSDYGVIATVFAFMALFNIIYQYGMDQAYLRFAEDNKTNDTPASARLCRTCFTRLSSGSDGSVPAQSTFASGK